MEAPLWLGRADLNRLLSPDVVRRAIGHALVNHSRYGSVRWSYSGPGGPTLVMVGGDSADGPIVQKTLFIRPGNRQKQLPTLTGTLTITDPSTGMARVVADGAWFTGLRTAGIAAFATEHLAVSRARQTILGAGFEAAFHARALLAVGGLRALTIWNRTGERADRLIGELSADPAFADIVIKRAEALDEAIRTADVITTVTASPQPLITEEALGSAVLINAMGSYRADQREVSGAVIRGARIFADTPDVASESGEVALAQAESGEAIRIQLLSDRTMVTPKPGWTVMKSVGAAFYDVAVAQALLGEIS